MSSPSPTIVNVVPHTHWDREWYAPFQRFRARLVELLDDLLPRLESDETFTHFLLDGQVAVIDDYLAIRPHERARLERLAASGRLAIGPWYTLPDEFLVSGETHIRNLRLGLQRADAIGGAMRVGYLPDMFGHVAQMPQLFRLFGFDHAVVWRGVPAAIVRTGFWWEAPDGSRVRAEYLPSGYGNGAMMPEDPEQFAARIEAWISDHHDTLDGAPVLWMNGADHLAPQPFLPATIAAANALDGDRPTFRITALSEHLQSAPTDGLAVWRGEMRSGARTNVLMGVTSNRIDVRIAVARAERALEQIAEPLAASLLPSDRYPHALFATAWQAMCRNAAHDSVCACSDDEVVASVLDRYAQARQIAEAIEEQSLRYLADHLSHVGPVVVNPSARPRSGVVTVRFPGIEPWPGTQMIAVDPGEELRCHLPMHQAVAVIPEITGWTDRLDGASITRAGDTVTVVLHGDGSRGEIVADRSVVAGYLVDAAATGATEARLVVLRPPTHDALVAIDDVPASGWTPATPAARRDLSPRSIVVVEGTSLSNGLVTVAVDDTDGTFSIDGISGLGRLVDGGDRGDTYNWCPTDLDTVIDRPESVRCTVEERGPLRARLRIDRTYLWPERAAPDGSRRIGALTVEVATTLDLRSGERFVRVEVALDNRAEDHRLRMHFPLPESATGSRAECAFAVVERGLDAEGGPTETPLPTFPSRRFVEAGGLTIVHEGLNEYELTGVDPSSGTASELAVTLLRASRWLSAGPMPTRPLPAGPIVELHGSQCRGRHTMRFAIATGAADPTSMVEDAFVPLKIAYGAGLGGLPARHRGIEVRGAVVSAHRRTDDGRIELRVVNLADRPADWYTDGLEGDVVDLTGTAVGAFGGRVELRPYEIATVVGDLTTDATSTT